MTTKTLIVKLKSLGNFLTRISVFGILTCHMSSYHGSIFYFKSVVVREKIYKVQGICRILARPLSKIFFVFVEHKNFYWRHLVCPTIQTHIKKNSERVLLYLPILFPSVILSLSDISFSMGFLACPRILGFLHCVAICFGIFLFPGAWHTHKYMYNETVTAGIIVKPHYCSSKTEKI